MTIVYRNRRLAGDTTNWCQSCSSGSNWETGLQPDMRLPLSNSNHEAEKLTSNLQTTSRLLISSGLFSNEASMDTCLRLLRTPNSALDDHDVCHLAVIMTWQTAKCHLIVLALVPFLLLSFCASNQCSLSGVCLAEFTSLSSCCFSSSLTGINCSVFTCISFLWGSKASRAQNGECCLHALSASGCCVVKVGRLGNQGKNDTSLIPAAVYKRKQCMFRETCQTVASK